MRYKDDMVWCALLSNKSECVQLAIYTFIRRASVYGDSIRMCAFPPDAIHWVHLQMK